jgi:hypothetical protein
MIPCVIGFEPDTAMQMLVASGCDVQIVRYASRRGVEGADSERVIRQRCLGNNSIEITVSRFKTRAQEIEE